MESFSGNVMAQSDFEKLAHVHHHRLQHGRRVLNEAALELDALQRRRQTAARHLASCSDLMDEAETLLAGLRVSNAEQRKVLDEAAKSLSAPKRPLPQSSVHSFERLEILDEAADVDELVRVHLDYAKRHNVDCDSRLSNLLPLKTVEDLRQRLDEDFTYHTARCDKYEYMIAGTAGILGGLVDVFLVAAPGEGVLGVWADDAVDASVRGFARLCGWTPSEDSDPTRSAIGFLERQFRVNYDHRHGADVGHAFQMGAKNHHIKSLAHSPDIVGLFFSILGQFTDMAYFVDDGRLFSVAGNGELASRTVPSKIFAGFVNWLGHLFSDVAGSSGAVNRGAGIPIPFFGLLQFVNVGEFGLYRQPFSKICVQVFEKGYDLRHGLAMTVPVVLTELIVRVMYMLKRWLCHSEPLSPRVAFAKTPELQRMLFVAHGALCIVDAGDAALRSGGNMIAFLARTNLVAWVRFGLLAYKEFSMLVKSGHIDANKLDSWIEEEYRRLLVN